MKKYLILYLLSFTLLSFTKICNKVGVKRTWLTSKRQFAGIISRNEDGTRSKGSWMTHHIYLELASDNKITWDSVLFDNKIYALSSLLLKTNPAIVGKNIVDSNDVIIKAKSDRKIMQLSIQDCDIEFEEKKYSFKIFGTKEKEVINYECSLKNINLIYDLTM